MFIFLVYWILASVAIVAALATIIRVRIPTGWVVVLLVVGSLVVLVKTMIFIDKALKGQPGFWTDFSIFYKVGNDVLAGRNPYADEFFDTHRFLNPPTCLPVFAGFALVPFGVGLRLWAALNFVLALALVPLSWIVLKRQATDENWDLAPSTVALLTAVLMLSNTVNPAINVGQMPIFASICLLLALLSQSAHRPVLAGLLLAIATLKVGTVVPFLLLFLRRSDWKTWIALGGGVAILCLSQATPLLLPEQIASELKQIQKLGGPGMVNDYTTSNPNFAGIIGLDSLVYWLGLTDRGLVRLVEKSAVLVLTAWVAFQVLRRDRLPRGAACALVCINAVLFLYHRNYDLVLLALPLTYVVGRLQGPIRAAERLYYTGAACALVLSLFQYETIIRKAIALSAGRGPLAALNCALIVPAVTWLPLLGAVFISLGARTHLKRIQDAEAVLSHA